VFITGMYFLTQNIAVTSMTLGIIDSQCLFGWLKLLVFCQWKCHTNLASLDCFMQAQFSQMQNPVGVAQAMPTRLPIYPPRGPGLSQPMFYGQGPPTLMPPQVNMIYIHIF
jgi:hypothetical protein